MMLGLRDYVNKNRFPGVVLGLSGGIDSALVGGGGGGCAGPGRVRCVMMPSRYTAQDSLDDAEECAKLLGVAYETIGIEQAVDAFGLTLAPVFAGRAADTTEENIQSRIRGLILMALSNKFGPMVLTTGNKSEMSVGYATLYGDMCGGYNVLKDIYKMDVFKLSHWRNANMPSGALGPAGRVIPRAHHHQAAIGGTEAQSDRPGQPAAVRHPRRHSGVPGRTGTVVRRGGGQRLCPRHRQARRAFALLIRIQAPPSPAGSQNRPPQLRPRPPLSDHQRLPGCEVMHAAITSSLSSPAENKREAFGRGEGDPGENTVALFKNMQHRLLSLTLRKCRYLGSLPSRCCAALAGNDNFYLGRTVP
jgi:hypothetical protein